jgi:glutamate racemase
MEKNRPVGIFDSGIGGLTVVKAVNRLLPNEDIVYLADTARFPFGNKSKSTIEKYSLEISEFLIHKDVKMIIIACNTASSLGIEAVRKVYDLPVLGVIGPGARTALKISKNRKIGVIGTRATINSGSYIKALKLVDPNVEIFSVPTPLLVPLAEEGWNNSDITKKVAEIYLASLLEKEIDTLILGCTHYPLIKEMIGEILGRRVNLVDSAEALALEARQILIEKQMAREDQRPGKIKYYTTDAPESFIETGSRLIDLDLGSAEQAVIL